MPKRTIAITRPVSHSLARCELTHLQRTEIDVARAIRQHAQYEDVLRSLGCDVVQLAVLHDHPDAVFVEDTVVVIDELAVLTRPGAASRRAETASMRALLANLLPVHEIAAPGTIDGGDVLRVGRRVYVGISTRTNEAGAAQLAALLGPRGYSVTQVQVQHCLHLKSAVTALSDDLVIANPNAVRPSVFATECLAVPEREAHAANVLAVNGAVLCPADAPLTAGLLQDRGFRVIPVDNSELAKAEGGLTCCSVIVMAS